MCTDREIALTSYLNLPQRISDQRLKAGGYVDSSDPMWLDDESDRTSGHAGGGPTELQVGSGRS